MPAVEPSILEAGAFSWDRTASIAYDESSKHLKCRSFLSNSPKFTGISVTETDVGVQQAIPSLITARARELIAIVSQ